VNIVGFAAAIFAVDVGLSSARLEPVLSFRSFGGSPQ